MTINSTCDNAISEFLPFSTFNWSSFVILVLKRQFFYILEDIDKISFACDIMSRAMSPFAKLLWLLFSWDSFLQLIRKTVTS